MLLSISISIFIITLTYLFLPINTKHKRWRSFMLIVIFFILIGLIPLNSSFFSLAPFVFTASYCLWISSIMKRFIPYIASHAYYIPARVPYPLIPLLYILEIISDLVRPLALTVRIVVNLSLRHLFIHRSARAIIRIFMPLILLFELAVAFIQGYIYSSLPSLW